MNSSKTIAQMALSIIKSMEGFALHEKQATLACVAAMIQAQEQSEQAAKMRPPDEEFEG